METKNKPKFIIEDDDEITTEQQINVVVNKGTGAGGANTNYYGKIFRIYKRTKHNRH